MNQPTSNGNPHGLIDHSHFVGRTRVAYFSMEIAISPEMPTYSGGLGILGVQAAQTVGLSPTRHIRCGPNAWKKRVRVGFSRPTASMGAATQFHARLGHTIWREVVRRSGSGLSAARRIGMELQKRQSRWLLVAWFWPARASHPQGAEIDNLSAVRIAAEKISAGLPPDRRRSKRPAPRRLQTPGPMRRHGSAGHRRCAHHRSCRTLLWPAAQH